MATAIVKKDEEFVPITSGDITPVADIPVVTQDDAAFNFRILGIEPTTTTPVSALPPAPVLPAPTLPAPTGVPLTQEQLQKRPDETNEQYIDRIAGLRGDTTENVARQKELLGVVADVAPEVIPEPEPLVEGEPTVAEPTALTPEQQAIESANKAIRDLNEKLLGRAKFRLTEEVEAGLPGLEATQRDLQGRLQALINQAQAIPLGLTTRAAKESGISTFGISTLRRDDLRENAIGSLAIAAQLQATQGNIATAQDMVDRAVEMKYGPIEEEIEVKLANLELALLSPSFTQSEKNKAAELKAEIEADKEKVATQKAEQKAIWDISVAVAGAGASADVLRQIQESQTKEEALRLAAPFLREAEGVKKDELLSVSEAKALKVPFGTTKAEAIAMGLTPKDEPSASQFNVANFASRMQQANPIIGNLSVELSKLSKVEFFAQLKLPSALQSDLVRQFVQAETNLITAILRRESGAAIAPDEFVDARKVYIPQPGDDATTLAQKKAVRDLVQRNFISEAGGAFEPAPVISTKIESFSGLGSSIQEALDSGFSAEETLTFLKENKSEETVAKITEAESFGYSPQQILNFLKGLNQ